MKKTLISAIALIASITAAAAADIPAAAPAGPPVYTPPPVSPAYNWTGFYIGAMGGYGQTNNQSPNLKGGFAGGTIGGNWQIANIVLGAEAEGAWSNIGASQSYLDPFVSASFADRIQAFGSVTGRVGVAIDNVLIYAKGGFAAASEKNTFSFSGFGIGALAGTGSSSLTGYTVGGGVEYGFTPNWSAKAEYLFAGYKGDFGARYDVHTVKLGINYRWGWGGPVVARY